MRIGTRALHVQEMHAILIPEVTKPSMLKRAQ